MVFTYYGHSCFMIETAGKKFLFDPFISSNPMVTDIDVSSIEADFILISHGHVDHILDAEAIAKKSKATVVCSWEIFEWLSKKGVENIRPMNTGGTWEHEWGSIQCTIAHHSSGLPDGSYGGSPMGFSITTSDGRLHYSGDTALTLDMQLIGSYYRPDWCVLPVGDNFTMGYKDALIASDFLQCHSVIGVHFDTFEYIKINHEVAVNHFAEHGKLLYLPQIGDILDLERVH